VREQSSRFFTAIPAYPAAVAGIVASLGFEINGETHGLGWMLRWLLITAIAGVMTEYAVRAVLARIRRRGRSASGGASWTKRFLANAAIDVLALASMFLVVSVMSDHWLPERGAAASVGAKTLSLFFWWRITVMFLKVWFRPDDAECRIVAVGDADAKLLARALSLIILAYEVGDCWMHVQTVAGMPVKALSVAVLIDNIERTLKARGFARPPGSPRLVTRLRRIKELFVSPTGMITVMGEPAGAEPAAEAVVAAEAPVPGPATGQRRRRSRRGGRRHRRAAPGGPPLTS
jgi:hypothetical protein